MKTYDILESELNHGWKSFLGILSCQTAVREIRKGIDDDLMKALEKSSFFKSRVENISPNYKKWPKSREMEWAEARRAEVSMEENFLKLTRAEGLVMLSSISHTDNPLPLVVAVSSLLPIELTGAFQGVGIDIESAQRVLKPEVIDRFLDPEERRHDLTLAPLDYWVMKEAAFKATPRDLQMVVTKYKLQNWNTELREGIMVSKNVKCPVKLIESSGFKLGLSYYRF